MYSNWKFQLNDLDRVNAKTKNNYASDDYVNDLKVILISKKQSSTTNVTL